MKKTTYVLIVAVFMSMLGGMAQAKEQTEYHARDYKALYYIRHHMGKYPQCDKYARSIITLEDSVIYNHGLFYTDTMNYIQPKGLEMLLKFAPKHEARADKCLAKYKKGWKK